MLARLPFIYKIKLYDLCIADTLIVQLARKFIAAFQEISQAYPNYQFFT